MILQCLAIRLRRYQLYEARPVWLRSVPGICLMLCIQRNVDTGTLYTTAEVNLIIETFTLELNRLNVRVSKIDMELSKQKNGFVNQ